MVKNVFDKGKTKQNASESVRKRQILSVASDLFARFGFSATIDQIAETMGVTKGHIYYYFSSKQEILYQIFRQAMGVFLEEIHEANDSILPVDERLKAVLKSHIISICDNQAVMTVFMDLRKDLNPSYWQEIVCSRKYYERLIQNLIKEGIEKRLFIHQNEKLLSYTILGSINWVYVWFKEEGGESAENVAEIMSNYLVNGLRRWHNLSSVKLGRSINEISINDSASFKKTINDTDVFLFAGITGDYNPMYISDEFARKTSYGKRIVHEGITTSLISPVLGNMLPGLGTVTLESTYRHKNPVYPGDTITASAIVTDKYVEKNLLKMDLKWINQNDEEVAEGKVTVMPPVRG